MTLNPDTASFLEQFGSMASAPTTDQEIEALLANGRTGAAGSVLEGESEPVDRVEDIAVPGPGGPVPVRVYRPGGEDLPVVVFIHGGCFILGDLEMHDPVLRRLANAIPAVVVSVDYRLAQESPFPAAIDDCVAALEWSAEHAQELGGDPSSLIVMGDSAGGALAAVTAARVRDSGSPDVRLQVLVYPMIDPSLRTDSAQEFAEGYLTTTALLELGWRTYLDGQTGAPYSAPAAIDDLQGLPPAVVITAGYDPLRDEGQDYVTRLKAAGVEVTTRHYPGQIHGFAFMPAVIPEATDALVELPALIRDALRKG